MKIQLEEVVPIPLKDKIERSNSEIWNSKVEFLPGERIKIKAPSGTGKTTLTNIIYKLRHDYSGRILWGKEDVKKIKGDFLAAKRQQTISIIFQDLRLFENLTARENIELNRVLQKPYYEAEMIEEMAEKLGITSILNQNAGICSYGEQQRIAIIRALVQPFEWLIMDEPFSHLDNTNIEKAAKLIAEECTKRKAGFILTDLEEDEHFDYTHFYNL